MFEKLAKSIEWPDTHLHDEIRCGFRLVGAGTKSNIFKPDLSSGNHHRERAHEEVQVFETTIEW